MICYIDEHDKEHVSMPDDVIRGSGIKMKSTSSKEALF